MKIRYKLAQVARQDDRQRIVLGFASAYEPDAIEYPDDIRIVLDARRYDPSEFPPETHLDLEFPANTGTPTQSDELTAVERRLMNAIRATPDSVMVSALDKDGRSAMLALLSELERDKTPPAPLESETQTTLTEDEQGANNPRAEEPDES